MSDFYAPPAMKRPLMKGDVPVPKNDDEARALIAKSKAAFDDNGDHPEMADHVEAVLKALAAWHKSAPSQFSAQVISALENDPNLQKYRK